MVFAVPGWCYRQTGGVLGGATCAGDVDGSLLILLAEDEAGGPCTGIWVGLGLLLNPHGGRDEVALLPPDRHNQRERLPHIHPAISTLKHRSRSV